MRIQRAPRQGKASLGGSAVQRLPGEGLWRSAGLPARGLPLGAAQHVPAKRKLATARGGTKEGIRGTNDSQITQGQKCSQGNNSLSLLMAVIQKEGTMGDAGEGGRTAQAGSLWRQDVGSRAETEACAGDAEELAPWTSS